MKRIARSVIFLLAIFTAFNTNAQAPKTPAGKTLYNTIIGLDRQVFDAYNKCDLDKFEDYFDSDVEFFNDRTGYTSSRHDLMKSMRTMCENGGMERVLISAQVYPMDFYGAVETGINKFYKITNGKRKLVYTARFVHIWKQGDDNDGWKIVRVISYDHKAQ